MFNTLLLGSIFDIIQRDCALSADYDLTCNNSIGGMLELYIIEHALFEAGTVTIVGGAVTVITNAATKKWRRYKLPRSTSGANSKSTVSEENGTKFYTETVKIALNTLSAATSQELEKVSANRLAAIVVDKNKNGWLYGYENGLTVSSADAGTGTAPGDRNGYMLELGGIEALTPYYVPKTLFAGLLIAGV